MGIMLLGHTEGSYIWVNKNLIEAAIMVMIFLLPKIWFFSLDNILSEFMAKYSSGKKTGSIEVPQEDNPDFSELPLLDRRRVLKNLISLPVLGVFTYAVAKILVTKVMKRKDLELMVLHLHQ